MSLDTTALGVEVERGLGAGEVAEGLGPADGQGLGRPERLAQRGAVGEGTVDRLAGGADVTETVNGSGDVSGD